MKLSSILLWTVLLMASGCATAYREGSADEALAEAVPTEAELDDQLTSDQLSEAQLSAFEIRAQQKLRDFVDYLNIIGNPSLDSTFRAEAARQAEQMFVSPQTVVVLRVDHESEALSVRYLLRELVRTSTADSLTIAALTVLQPLAPSSEPNQYQGRLSLRLAEAGGSNTELGDYQANVIVKKAEKSFGEEIEAVWDVFLGDLR